MALAHVLLTLLNDSEYDKVAGIFSGALPTAKTLKESFSFSPPMEGFQVEQFVKLKTVWQHELSLLHNTSLDSAAALLEESPYVYLSEDETCVRQGLKYIKNRDHIIGLVHDNKAHTFVHTTIDNLDAKLEDPQQFFADKVNCILLKLARFPQLPPFLLAIVPTSSRQRGRVLAVDLQELMLGTRPW